MNISPHRFLPALIAVVATLPFNFASIALERENAVQPSITLDQAIQIAKAKLAESRHQMVLLDRETREFPFGWVFSYKPKKFLETKDVRDLVPGGAPLVVNRDGTTVELPSRYPSDVAIKKYLESWEANRQNQK